MKKDTQDIFERMNKVLEQRETDRKNEMKKNPLSINSKNVICLKQDKDFLHYPMAVTKTTLEKVVVKDSDGNELYQIIPAYKDYGGCTQVADLKILEIAIAIANETYETTGKIPSQYFEFTSYEMLKRLGFSTGKDNYKWLRNALYRLDDTKYRGKFFADKGWSEGERTFISHLSLKEKNTKKNEINKIGFFLDEKFFDAIINQNVLSLGTKFFKLKNQFCQLLFRIIRSHIGNQKSWEVTESRMQELMLSDLPSYKFRFKITQHIKKLPFNFIYEKIKDEKYLYHFTLISQQLNLFLKEKK